MLYHTADNAGSADWRTVWAGGGRQTSKCHTFTQYHWPTPITTLMTCLHDVLLKLFWLTNWCKWFSHSNNCRNMQAQRRFNSCILEFFLLLVLFNVGLFNHLKLSWLILLQLQKQMHYSWINRYLKLKIVLFEPSLDVDMKIDPPNYCHYHSF